MIIPTVVELPELVNLHFERSYVFALQFSMLIITPIITNIIYFSIFNNFILSLVHLVHFLQLVPELIVFGNS